MLQQEQLGIEGVDQERIGLRKEDGTAPKGYRPNPNIFYLVTNFILCTFFE